MTKKKPAKPKTSVKPKKLSNPVSTGGGGSRFENLVQSVFVVSMLTGGSVPCLNPGRQIISIEFQARKSGIETDDCVVTVDAGSRKNRLLAQIKRDISITQGSEVFAEVIGAALVDFRDPLFLPNDAIALITGPLSSTDINDVRLVLHRARTAADHTQFFGNMKLANHTSDGQRKKLAAFRFQLKKANKGLEVSDSETFDFLRVFHLIGYDLEVDGASSSTHALLASTLSPFGIADHNSLLALVGQEVASYNQTGGILTLDNIPITITSQFPRSQIVTKLGFRVANEEPSAQLLTLSGGSDGTALLSAAIMGSWREDSKGDQAVLERLIDHD